MPTSYISTVPGLLKIIEAVLCLGGFISAIIPYDWTSAGGGWTQFVTITALFGVVGILIANMFLVEKLPPIFPLLVLIFYAVYDLFLLSAGILTAVRAGQVYTVLIFLTGYNLYQSIAAAAFFVLAAFVVFVIDTILSFSAWRASSAQTQSSSTHTTATTTSKTTVVVS
ncbi:plasmolipin-like [Liolophura sinensis]|uniref:plasmolipin-like n=1 Tax=Liolophura sinensis TaxID=3198878 RepID=UPI003159681D